MKPLKLLKLCIALAIAFTSCAKNSHNEQQAQEPVVRYEYGLPVDSFRIDTCVVKDGETLGGMLNRLGATRQQINGITLMSRSEFDVRTIRPGKTYYALFQTDTAGVEHLHYYIYLPNIREAVVLHLTDSMHVERFEKPITRQNRAAEVVIETSLWNAMVGKNLPPELAIELSDIYAWTIDFFGLQKGDSIRVYYEEQYVDSIRIGIGRIYAADFYHGRRWQEAYWFEEGNIHNYFDAEGHSLRKAFLKAPLKFSRISSGFSYARKHPVTRKVQPHTGVDYAAPKGTPVMSIGDGVVVYRAYSGAGGNMVKIKHNSVYTSAYLHLSRYAKGLNVGDRVRQGEVIGYVGSTGRSTGPHLDFRVWKNGTPINPLKMESPPTEPVKQENMEAFEAAKKEADHAVVAHLAAGYLKQSIDRLTTSQATVTP